MPTRTQANSYLIPTRTLTSSYLLPTRTQTMSYPIPTRTPTSLCTLQNVAGTHASETRSSADADNGLDAFSGQSRSTNMVPFHMLHIVSYCAVVTLSLRRAVFTIFVFKKFHDLEMGVKGHSRSLRVISFNRLCMVSY